MSIHESPPAAPCTPGPDGRCALCADEALETRVLAVHPAARLADVQLPGGAAIVALDLVDGVAAGDRVLVHQGFIIGRLDGSEGSA